MAQAIFNDQNSLLDLKMFQNRFLTIMSLFRGEQLEHLAIDQELRNITTQKSSYFVEWVADSYKVGYVDQKNVIGPKQQGLLVGNSMGM